MLRRASLFALVPVPLAIGLASAQEAPRATRAYAIETYVADLAALLDTLGIDKVRLVGHDWAAAVGSSPAIPTGARF
jgi:pimeloyl-ACP methyl ester carboxylesterase